MACRIEMFSISVFSKSSTINICYSCHQRRKISFTYFFKFTGGHGQRSAFRQSSAPAEEPQHTQRTQCELTLPGSGAHVTCLSLGAPHEGACDQGLRAGQDIQHWCRRPKVPHLLLSLREARQRTQLCNVTGPLVESQEYQTVEKRKVRATIRKCVAHIKKKSKK